MQKDILIEYYPDVHSKTSLATYDYQMLLDSSKNYKVDYFTGKQRDTQMAALAFALQPELPDTAEIAKINGVDYQMTKASFIDMLNRKDDYLATVLFETKVDQTKQDAKIKQAAKTKTDLATNNQTKPTENQANKQIIEYQPAGSHAYKEVDFNEHVPADKEKVRKIGLSKLSYVFNYHDLKSLLTGKHANELFSKPIGIVPSNGKITANRRKSFSDNAGLDSHALDNAEATKIGTVENTVNKNKYIIYTFTVKDNVETKLETKDVKSDVKAAEPKAKLETNATNSETKAVEPEPKSEVNTAKSETQLTQPETKATKPDENAENKESSENMMPNTTNQTQANTQKSTNQDDVEVPVPKTDMSKFKSAAEPKTQNMPNQTAQTNVNANNDTETQPMTFPNVLVDGGGNTSTKDEMDFVAQMFNGNANSNTSAKTAPVEPKKTTTVKPETNQTAKSEQKMPTATNSIDTSKVEHKLDSINRKIDQVLIATNAVKNAVTKDQSEQTASVQPENQPIGPNPNHDAKDETLQELIARQSNLTKAQLKSIPQAVINFCFSKNAVSPMARANAIFKLNEILMKGPIPEEYKCLTDPELYLKVVHLLSWFN